MSTVHDNPELSRYELLDGDEVAAFTEYRRDGDVLRFVHTETNPAHTGKGVAKELVTTALDDVRRRGLSVLPECPYVRRVIAENAERFLDLVPAAERANFELPAA